MQRSCRGTLPTDLDLAEFLDAVNYSSGVNVVTLNRFPRVIEGEQAARAAS